jgi:hypothetical protein
MEKTELKSRALIGGLLNMSSDCLENLRPRAQYMHFYRLHYKKVKNLIYNGTWVDETRIYLNILKDILKIYQESPIPSKNNCIDLSKKHLSLLKKYGYKETRDLGEKINN